MRLAQDHQQEAITVRHRADKTVSADTTKHRSSHTESAPNTRQRAPCRKAHNASRESPVPLAAYLVVGVHLGHHPLFQKVKGQDLQDIQLMGHLGFDWAVPSDHMLERTRAEG